MDKIVGFTPGPWQHDGNGDFVSVSMDASKMICDIRGWGWLQKLGEAQAIEIQKANGELIALAPTLYEQHFKMLEALKELYRLTSHEGCVIGSEGARFPLYKAFNKTFQKAEQTIKECEL